MALNARSLVTAARSKARQAQEQVVAAEHELHEANEKLKQALPSGDAQQLASAAKQTVAAEQKVHVAAEQLDAVEALLSQTDGTDCSRPAQGATSGTGAASLLPHLRRVR